MSDNTIVERNTYSVSKQKHMIDINKGLTNFKAHFTVSSDSDKPYYLVVANQEQLDSDNRPEFHEVVGSMSGDVVNDKNTNQEYFLILYASQPMSIAVELVREALPDNIQQSNESSSTPSLNMSGIDIPYAKIALVIICIALIYYLYKNDKLKLPSSAPPIPPVIVQSTSLLDKLKKIQLD